MVRYGFHRVRGARHDFEVHGPVGGRGHLLVIRPTAGEVEVFERPDLPGICREVDRWLAAHPHGEPGDGFRGFGLEVWDHETRQIRRVSYPTRGALLLWFDCGTMPTPEQVADAEEWCGDVTLVVTDGNGCVLLDRRQAASDRVASLTAWRITGP